MKEFKKWFGKEIRPPNWHFPMPSEAWEEALKWVYSLYEKYDSEDWDVVACNIKKDIEDELK